MYSFGDMLDCMLSPICSQLEDLVQNAYKISSKVIDYKRIIPAIFLQCPVTYYLNMDAGFHDAFLAVLTQVTSVFFFGGPSVKAYIKLTQIIENKKIAYPVAIGVASFGNAGLNLIAHLLTDTPNPYQTAGFTLGLGLVGFSSYAVLAPVFKTIYNYIKTKIGVYEE